MGIKPILLWLPMIMIAFANAALRELWFVRYFSELKSHQLSTITLILFCAVYIWFVYPVLNFQNYRQAWLTGFVWVMLTVIFEFTLGWFTNRPMEYIFRDYNFFAGRIWLIFLLCLFILPYLVYIVRNK